MQTFSNRLGELFGSRTPMLVVLAGLAIALIGDGIIALITAAVSGTAFTIGWWLLGVGLLTLLILVGGFDLLGNLRYSLQRGKSHPEPHASLEPVAQRRGLIALVSNRPNPPAASAIRHHAYTLPGGRCVLEHCWLIAGPGTGAHSSADNAARLAKEWRAKGIAVDIMQLDSALDPQHSYHTTQQCLNAALSLYLPHELAVDCTGGTKMMTVGMVMAAANTGIQIEFLSANQLGSDGRPARVAGGAVQPVKLE